MTDNKELVGMLENAHLLRKLFVRRTSENSPLHFGQIAIMKTIEQNEHCTQATIAERLGVSPASVATSTKRLQKAGLITKTIDEDDIRCKRLALTDKGRSAIRDQLSIFQEYDDLAFSGFSEEDKAMLMELLSRMVDNMRRAEGIEWDCSVTIGLTHLLHRMICEMKGDK